MKTYKQILPSGIAAAALLLACAVPQSARADAEDVTAQYVNNADFTGSQTAWNLSTNNMGSTSQGNGCQEFWTSNLSNGCFRMSQLVCDLPEGVYRLTANAFTRAEGDTWKQTCLYAIADEKEYATPLKLLHEETGDYGSVPDNMSEAATAFSAGHWLNTVDHIIVTQGRLTIGARNIGQLRNGSSNGSWTIIGNVKLYRLTGADLKPLMTETLGAAQALAEEGDFTGKEKLAAAISAATAIGEAALEWADIRTLKQAMADYRTTRLADASETTPVDATHLIRNAGFEDGFIPVLPTANGGYSAPAGFTLNYGPTHVNNNIGTGQAATLQAGYNGGIDPTEGKQALAARMRWSDGSVMDLTQPVSLPAGKYTLSADLGTLGVSETVALTMEDAGGTALCSLAPTQAAPSAQSATFELTTGATCTLRIKLVQSGTTDARMAVDNIRLAYAGTTSNTSAGAQGETVLPRLDRLMKVFIADFNGKPMQKPAWENLVQRVAEAETAKDDTGSTAASLTTAADNLEAAMQLAAPTVEAYTVLGNLVTVLADCEAMGDATFKTVYDEASATATNATATADEAADETIRLRSAYLNYLLSHSSEATADISALLVNPNFEEGEAWANTDEPYVYAPTGWTVDFEADNQFTGYKHIRAVDYGTAYDDTTPATPDEASCGASLLYMRSNWDAAHEMRVSQQVVLPAGRYRLSARVNHLSGTPETQLSYVATATGKQSLWPSATGTWETVSREFELDNDGEVTVSFGFSTVGGSQSNSVKFMADDVRLELLPPAYIADYIAAKNAATNYSGQINATAFPTVAKRLDAALAADVSEGTEAAYVAATGLLQEAANFGRSACAIDTQTGNATGVIVNPEADDNTTGWTTSGTVNTLAGESYKGTSDNYFDGGNWSGTGWDASMKQDIYLPAGYYSLTFVGRCAESTTLAVSLGGQTLTLAGQGNTGGNVQAYGEADSNNGNGYGWNKAQIGFQLTEDTKCALSVDVQTDAQQQWFSIDGFTLTYAAKAGTATVSDNRIKATGAIAATELEALVNAETRSVDLRGVSVLVGTPSWPDEMNPNCVVYAPTGMLQTQTNVVCNAICTDFAVTDRKPLNVPEAFTALQATYSRNAYTDGLPETIVLPFGCSFPDGFAFEEITEEAENYVKSKTTDDAAATAGKAYLMRYTGEKAEGTTELTFSNTGVEIAAFAEPTVEGLFGSTDYYYLPEGETSVYMLSASDCKFKRALEGSYSAPFRACYASNFGAAQSNLNLVVDGTTGVAASTWTESSQPVDVYDLGGRLVRKQAAPQQALDGLRPGIYIVNQQKTIVR